MDTPTHWWTRSKVCCGLLHTRLVDQTQQSWSTARAAWARSASTNLRRRLEERGLASVLSLRAANGVREAPLNDCCGAEHVQKQRLPPKILSRRDLGVPNLRGCSLDGDADRLVYWFHGFKF